MELIFKILVAIAIIIALFVAYEMARQKEL